MGADADADIVDGEIIRSTVRRVVSGIKLVLVISDQHPDVRDRQWLTVRIPADGGSPAHAHESDRRGFVQHRHGDIGFKYEIHTVVVGLVSPQIDAAA